MAFVVNDGGMSVDADAIVEANLQKPATASADGRAASQHSLSDQIAAAKFLAAQAALAGNDGDAWGGCTKARAKPGDAVQ